MFKTTLEEVERFRTARFENSMAIIRKKGADYNRAQQNDGDTLFNLKVSELIGVVETTEQGILVRLTDKLMRLVSLTKPGEEPANVDETVIDTIEDIHNYVDYLGLVWSQRRAQFYQAEEVPVGRSFRPYTLSSEGMPSD